MMRLPEVPRYLLQFLVGFTASGSRYLDGHLRCLEVDSLPYSGVESTCLYVNLISSLNCPDIRKNRVVLNLFAWFG